MVYGCVTLCKVRYGCVRLGTVGYGFVRCTVVHGV